MNWPSLLIADGDPGGWICPLTCVAIFVILLWAGIVQAKKQAEIRAKMSPEERRSHDMAVVWGSINPALICPHCQTKGQVRTKGITQRKGISGAKATGAILTGGVSMLATGLSRKEDATQAHCDDCGSKWVF